MNTVKRPHLSTVVIVCLMSIGGQVSAQHSGGHTTSERPSEQHESHESQSTSGNHQATDHRGAMADMGTPTGMFASGTALEPHASMDANPMLHTMLGNWNLMLHAKAFVLTTQQSGPRGRDRFFSANWLMPMLSRQMGAHSLTFRTMLSLEPATVTDRRYPALFQTGETAYGLPIVDGQHPHDLFMEIAGLYAYTPSEGTKLFVYGGPVGEPSIGPPAYPHRTSASENPIAGRGRLSNDLFDSLPPPAAPRSRRK